MTSTKLIVISCSLLLTGTAAIAQGQSTHTPAPLAGKWTYTDKKDEMTSQYDYYATVTSENRVHLEWPYHGGNVKLSIVKDNTGLNIILSMPDGQFHASDYNNPAVLLRFDDEPPVSVAYVKSPDASPNKIYLQPEGDILARLSTAKTLKIEAGFYQAGRQVLTFNVRNFIWNTRKHGEKETE